MARLPTEILSPGRSNSFEKRSLKTCNVVTSAAVAAWSLKATRSSTKSCSAPEAFSKRSVGARDTPTSSGGQPPFLAARDRKSTRLNSSHANISYAVFCLKKKKKQSYKYN